MLLDVIIIASGAKTANLDRAYASVGPLAEKYTRVEPEEVVAAIKNSEADWIMLLYDNEWIDDHVRSSLPTFLLSSEYNFFLIFKKVRVNGALRHYEAPRIFKRGVEINSKDFTPSIMQPHTLILDGWVLEEDRDG